MSDHKIPEIDPAYVRELMAQYAESGMGQDDGFSLNQMRPYGGSEEEPRSLALADARSHPAFDELNPFDQWGARGAEHVLNIGTMSGHLDLTGKRIVDFGAGHGGPTVALAQLTAENGGQVDAVESRPESAADIVNSGILPEGQVHQADGIDYLRARAQASEPVDVVTAFMLGPDDNGSLTNALLDAAHEATDGKGQLVVTSDGGTMETVKQVCDRRGIAYELIQGLPTEPGEPPVPNAFVISLGETSTPSSDLSGLDGFGESKLPIEKFRGYDQFPYPTDAYRGSSEETSAKLDLSAYIISLTDAAKEL